MGGADEVRPPYCEWGEDLRGASGCPQGVAGTVPAKNTDPKVGLPKGLRASRRVGYSHCGGIGEVRPQDSE